LESRPSMPLTRAAHGFHDVRRQNFARDTVRKLANLLVDLIERLERFGGQNFRGVAHERRLPRLAGNVNEIVEAHIAPEKTFGENDGHSQVELWNSSLVRTEKPTSFPEGPRP
jgi:hypothetical protein